MDRETEIERQTEIEIEIWIERQTEIEIEIWIEKQRYRYREMA